LPSTIVRGASGLVGEAFKTIASIGPNQFFDMLRSAIAGSPMTDATTDVNFQSRASTFFNAYGTTLAAIGAQFLPTDAHQLAGKALSDVDTRVALAGLSIVSVQANATVKANFSLYDASTGTGEITQDWITDRAAFTANYFKKLQGPGGIVPGSENLRFYDAQANIEVLVGSGSAQRKQYLFGGDAADTLSGQGFNDHLYGGANGDSLNGLGGADRLEGNAGSDTLIGGQGADILLGGAGTDEYQFTTGDGRDTIVDSDGLGSIKVDGTLLSGGKKVMDNVWESIDHKTVYTLMGGNLIIGERASAGATTVAGTITVKDWQEGQLGIQLGTEEPPVPTPDHTYTGDHIKQTNGDSYVMTSSGEYANGGPEENANDILSGSLEDDSMVGGGGNDGIEGFLGDDSIDGGAGDDLLVGGFGADTIDGGAGNDEILGSANGGFWRPTLTTFTPPTATGPEMSRGFSWVIYQTADGGSVIKYLDLGAPNGETDGNYIDGGAGDDRIGAGSADDIAYGGEGNDTVRGLGGGDILFGEDGDDLVAGDGVPGYNLMQTEASQHGADFLDGGAGTDTVGGQGGDDEVYGGEGNDLLLGDDDFMEATPLAIHGNDYVDGEDGDDTLIGGGADDTLFGGAGNDRIGGDAGDVPTGNSSFIAAEYNGDDYVDGEDGDDTLVGDGGDDTLFGGAGNDTLIGDGYEMAGEDQGDDVLDGGDGNDHLWGNGGADELFGGAGNDTLSGDDGSLDAQYHGADYLDGEGGNDSLIGGGAADTLIGGAGNDELFGDAESTPAAQQAADLLDGGDGDDTLRGYGGDDVIEGGAGDDFALGDAGQDVLSGGDGDDELQGGADDDRIDGGAGNDLLVGDAGDDVLDGGAGIDELQGGDGDDVLYAGEGDVLFGQGGSDVLQGRGAFYADGGAGDDWVEGATSMFGGEGNDTIVGSGTAANGGAGDDTYVVDVAGETTVEAAAGGVDTVETGITWTLATEVEKLLLTGSTAVNGTGNASINWLTGNAGNNTLNGLAGADVLLGGAGNDTLQDTAGNGALDGGTGNDALTAGSGNDLVAGGTGNDTYTLGAGTDIVAFDRGDGVDTINAPLSGAGLGENNDVLSLGKIRFADITLSREVNDLVIHVTGTTDAIRFNSWYAQAGNQTFAKLQVMVDSSSDYAPGTSDLLRASRVAVLDFKQLVAGYDSARASNPSLVDWAASEALLQSARITSSGTQALGGSLAYRYANDGTLANAAYETAAVQLVGTGFGTAMQDVV
jgi:Ca2+-binding RTX toxin-like protein